MHVVQELRGVGLDSLLTCILHTYPFGIMWLNTNYGLSVWIFFSDCGTISGNDSTSNPIGFRFCP